MSKTNECIMSYEDVEDNERRIKGVVEQSEMKERMGE